MAALKSKNVLRRAESGTMQKYGAYDGMNGQRDAFR